MPHGGWHGGLRAGGVTERTKSEFQVRFRRKEFTKSKNFQTRAAAELWKKRTSDKHGLTFNQIRLCPSDPNVMEMRTTAGIVVRLDVQDYPLVKPYLWFISGNGYAKTRVRGSFIMMAPLIKPPPRGLILDHKNRIRSDNVRANLRHVTFQGNMRNCKASSTNTSGHHGISEHHRFYFTYVDGATSVQKSKGRWCAGQGPHQDVRKDMEALRDSWNAKTKAGSVPTVYHYARWETHISRGAVDGGRKVFTFNPRDEATRQNALRRATAERDRLQARTGSTNGKAPA